MINKQRNETYEKNAQTTPNEQPIWWKKTRSVILKKRVTQMLTRKLWLQLNSSFWAICKLYRLPIAWHFTRGLTANSHQTIWINQICQRWNLIQINMVHGNRPRAFVTNYISCLSFSLFNRSLGSKSMSPIWRAIQNWARQTSKHCFDSQLILYFQLCGRHWAIIFHGF